MKNIMHINMTILLFQEILATHVHFFKQSIYYQQ